MNQLRIVDMAAGLARSGRRLALALAAAVMLVALAGGAVFAAAAITAKAAGAFVVGDQAGYPAGHDFTIRVGVGSTVETLTVTAAPGADFGWHYHNAAVAVAVRSGSLTVIDAKTCASRTYTRGQGFVEAPHVVHLARNDGTTAAVLEVTYLGIPAGKSPDVPMASAFARCGATR
jgi:quercetin dioxygenase-like cupin family protein